MNSYLLTLIVRFLVAFSGFVVFFISSKLFGAEGRGIIGYGTSIVSIVGLLLSFNLGRSFFSETKQNENLKQKLLPDFLAINYSLIIVGIVFTILFWLINSKAKAIIDLSLLVPFLVLIPYYVWSVNGNPIFATLNLTSIQDAIIGIQRLILIVFMFLALILNIDNLTVFLFLYAIVLASGTLFEMIYLGVSSKGIFQSLRLMRYIKDSKHFHLDYLGFNLYPLILMIFAGSLLELSQLGNLNFIIQMINFVFILPFVASIRMKNYVAAKGAIQYIESIKKIFLFTFIASVIAIIVIFGFLNTSLFNKYFFSFSEVQSLFLIAAFAVPGYIAYQFIYPVLIEYNLIQVSMKINLLIITFVTSLTYPILKYYGLLGGTILFSLFYLLIFIAQIYFYRRLKPMLISN
jgi:O-antigen/teichoic acid export membrane protein